MKDLSQEVPGMPAMPGVPDRQLMPLSDPKLCCYSTSTEVTRATPPRTGHSLDQAAIIGNASVPDIHDAPAVSPAPDQPSAKGTATPHEVGHSPERKITSTEAAALLVGRAARLGVEVPPDMAQRAGEIITGERVVEGRRTRADPPEHADSTNEYPPDETYQPDATLSAPAPAIGRQGEMSGPDDSDDPPDSTTAQDGIIRELEEFAPPAEPGDTPPGDPPIFDKPPTEGAGNNWHEPEFPPATADVEWAVTYDGSVTTHCQPGAGEAIKVYRLAPNPSISPYELTTPSGQRIGIGPNDIVFAYPADPNGRLASDNPSIIFQQTTSPVPDGYSIYEDIPPGLAQAAALRDRHAAEKPALEIVTDRSDTVLIRHPVAGTRIAAIVPGGQLIEGKSQDEITVVTVQPDGTRITNGRYELGDLVKLPGYISLYPFDNPAI